MNDTNQKLDKIIELLNQITFLLTVHTIEVQPTPERQQEVKEKLAIGLHALALFMESGKP